MNPSAAGFSKARYCLAGTRPPRERLRMMNGADALERDGAHEEDVGITSIGELSGEVKAACHVPAEALAHSHVLPAVDDGPYARGLGLQRARIHFEEDDEPLEKVGSPGIRPGKERDQALIAIWTVHVRWDTPLFHDKSKFVRSNMGPEVCAQKLLNPPRVGTVHVALRVAE